MLKLNNWTAKRAGGAITITATDEDGSAVKITGIDRMTSSGKRSLFQSRPPVIAVHTNGTEYELA